MGVYDQSARFAANEEPEAVIARLLRDELVTLRFREWMDTRTTPTPGDRDLTADRVAALDDERDPKRPWLMVFEFQSRHDDDKLDVTLAEAARLRMDVRHGEDRRGKYRVLVGLVYLRGLCSQATLEMTLPSGHGTRHAALSWDVEADDAAVVLEDLEAGRLTWGILYWVPLMKNGGDAEVIRRWLELVETVPESKRPGLGRVALVFAELSGVLIAWQDALEGWQMQTESPLVNSWIEKAESRKAVETVREDLLMVLNRRFPGQVTSDVIETINQQPGVTILKTWLGEAAGAATFADFVAYLQR